jgi:hypothetical protein
MTKYLELEESYNKCHKEANFLPRAEIDIGRIKTIVALAQGIIKAINKIKEKLEQDSYQQSIIFNLYYDALHQLTEAFLRFDKIKVKNHHCLFAYLCKKHPELDFSWEFFERVRTLRNGVYYYANPVPDNALKETELYFIMYINKLIQMIAIKQ